MSFAAKHFPFKFRANFCKNVNSMGQILDLTSQRENVKVFKKSQRVIIIGKGYFQDLRFDHKGCLVGREQSRGVGHG